MYRLSYSSKHKVRDRELLWKAASLLKAKHSNFRPEAFNKLYDYHLEPHEVSTPHDQATFLRGILLEKDRTTGKTLATLLEEDEM